VLAAVLACSAVDASTCPALEPKDNDQLSAILQHVCKRGEGDVDCGEIPDLLKQLAEVLSFWPPTSSAGFSK
jgi:hypothetical protein